MIAGYRFARKKYQQRQAAKSSLAPAGNTKEPITSLPNDADAQTHQVQEAHTNTNLSNAPKTKCTQCKEEKSAVRKYRWKLLFCLLPAFFDASLDLTIVATALPEIASHFSQSLILRSFWPSPYK